MFRNKDTAETTPELPGRPTENEQEARMRLGSEGWVIPPGAFWDDTDNKFTMKKPAEDEFA